MKYSYFSELKYNILKKIIFLSIVVCSVLMFGCGDDDDMSTCETTDLTYTSDIASLFNNNCATSGCHVNVGGTSFSFESHTAIITSPIFDNIVPSINHESDVQAMPRPIGSAKLDDCTIDKITSWINDGAPE